MPKRLFLFTTVLLSLAACAPTPVRAPPGSLPAGRALSGRASASLAGDLDSEVAKVGGTWVSLSLRKGETTAPLVVFNVSVGANEQLAYRDVEIHVRAGGRELPVRAASNGPPSAGSTNSAGGTAWFDFTATNTELADLEEVTVTFRGETLRVSAEQLRPRRT